MANLYPDTILRIGTEAATVSELLGQGYSVSAIQNLIRTGAAKIVAEGSSASGAAVGSVADSLARQTDPSRPSSNGTGAAGT